VLRDNCMTCTFKMHASCSSTYIRHTMIHEHTTCTEGKALIHPHSNRCSADRSSDHTHEVHSLNGPV
jgi:hypothetical protein